MMLKIQDKWYAYPTSYKQMTTEHFCRLQEHENTITALTYIEPEILSQMSVSDVADILQDISFIEQDMPMNPDLIYSQPLRTMKWGDYELAAIQVKDSLKFRNIAKFIEVCTGESILNRNICETIETLNFYLSEFAAFNDRYKSMAAEESDGKSKAMAAFGVLPILEFFRGTDILKDDELLQKETGLIYDQLLYFNFKSKNEL